MDYDRSFDSVSELHWSTGRQSVMDSTIIRTSLKSPNWSWWLSTCAIGWCEQVLLSSRQLLCMHYLVFMSPWSNTISPQRFSHQNSFKTRGAISCPIIKIKEIMGTFNVITNYCLLVPCDCMLSSQYHHQGSTWQELDIQWLTAIWSWRVIHRMDYQSRTLLIYHSKVPSLILGSWVMCDTIEGVKTAMWERRDAYIKLCTEVWGVLRQIKRKKAKPLCY